MLDYGILAGPKFFGGRRRWRADSAANLRRKHLYIISGFAQTQPGLRPWTPSDPAGSPPLDRPAGGLPSRRLPVLTLTSEPDYVTDLYHSVWNGIMGANPTGAVMRD